MKKTLKQSLAFALAILSLVLIVAPTSAAETGIKRVVLVGVDGGGAFFKQADTPNLDRIFANGAITYTCLTSNPSISAQCWGAMLHGVTPEFHGLTNGIAGSRPYPEDSLFPSVFRVIHENKPDAVLASIVNWNPVNIGIVENNLGVVKQHGGDDEAVTDLVCKYLEKNDPTFLFVHFDGCDGAGHRFGYGTEKHLNQIHITDGYIQRIYEALEKRGFADSTLFLVTADHGGTNNDGKSGSHGGWTDAEKYIMFAATGPGVEKGEIQDMGVRDTASVVLYGLGLIDKQPETWTSRVPSGLFKGVTAKERPVYTIKYAFEHRTHETAPTPTGDASVVAKLGKDRVFAYFPFDGDVKDATGNVTAEPNGKLYFVENGYFGKSVQLDDGWVATNAAADKSSCSFAFWMKTGGVDEDPAIVSNKNWGNGTTEGFVLSLRQADVKFNVGDGKNRMDSVFQLPIDYKDGWLYVVAVVDREKGEFRLSYDFRPFETAKFPEELKDVDLNSPLGGINIGQDGTGKYRVNVGAELDELLLIDGALSDKDLATLKSVYVK